MADQKYQHINESFFCDGSGYLITSSSLGGSNLTPVEPSEKALAYREKFKEIEDAYIIRFSPLTKDPGLPELVEGIGWPGIFEYR